MLLTALERIPVPHLSEEELDGYLMGRLPAKDQIRIVEHVLCCDECYDRLEETLNLIEALQSG